MQLKSCINLPVLTAYVCHNNVVMTRKLIKTGNSDALVITKEMKEHLGVRESIAVYYEKGKIILERPTTFEEAQARTDEKFADVYEELAK